MLSEGKNRKVYIDYYQLLGHIITASILLSLVVLFAEGRYVSGVLVYLCTVTIFLQPCRQIAKIKREARGGAKISEAIDGICRDMRLIMKEGDKAFSKNIPVFIKTTLALLVYVTSVGIHHIALLVWGVLAAVALRLLDLH